MALPTSPKQKQKVISMIIPRQLFVSAIQIIARGSVYEASCSSSEMCVAASDQSKETLGASCPSTRDKLMLPRLALF